MRVCVLFRWQDARLVCWSLLTKTFTRASYLAAQFAMRRLERSSLFIDGHEERSL